MARRRRYQWIDAVDFTQTSTAANALGSFDQVTEAEIENLGGGLVLERIVGSLVVTNGAVGRGQYGVALWTSETFAGASLPTAAALQQPDFYQRKEMLWTGYGCVQTGADFDFGVPRVHHIDWRSKRKMGQGMKISLLVAPVSNAVRSSFHLRYLFVLP